MRNWKWWEQREEKGNDGEVMTGREASNPLRINPPLFMTKEEAAEVFHVSVRTLSDWINKHGLLAFKHEGTVRIMRDHLIAFYISHCNIHVVVEPMPSEEF